MFPKVWSTPFWRGIIQAKQMWERVWLCDAEVHKEYMESKGNTGWNGIGNRHEHVLKYFAEFVTIHSIWRKFGPKINTTVFP